MADDSATQDSNDDGGCGGVSVDMGDNILGQQTLEQPSLQQQSSQLTGGGQHLQIQYVTALFIITFGF